MNIEIFRPEQWNDFFVMVGGGSAALAGLVFVAISINLEIVSKDVTHNGRAIGTLTGFASVFMICASALIGGQSYKAIGAEWLLISTFAAYIYYRGIFRSWKKGVSPEKLPVGRVVLATVCYLSQIVGSIIFTMGHSVGLYVASLGMILLFASLISGAWLLLMGIHEQAK